MGSALIGCEPPAPSPPQDAQPPAAGTPAAPENTVEPATQHETPAPGPAAETAPPSEPQTPKSTAAGVDAAAKNAPQQPAASGEKANMEKAQVGVGKKGRGYGGGIYTEPLRQYFLAGQRITLLQIDQGMKLYKAQHGNKPPKTQEEFMKEIVQARNLKLPELPPGDEYWYDAEKGELMVKHPAK